MNPYYINYDHSRRAAMWRKVERIAWPWAIVIGFGYLAAHLGLFLAKHFSSMNRLVGN